MMKPTDEQLRDPKWWDENAPSDAEHLAIAPDDTIIFYRQDSVGTWQIWGVRHKQWMFDGFSHDAGKPPYELTPRSTKPAAPEWNGKGLPPVGCICECLFNDGWSKVAVLAHYGDESWVKRPRKTHIVSKGLGNEFRPIRTKEQRDRDELQEIISDAYESGVGVIAAEIIAAGWTREKQDD